MGSKLRGFALGVSMSMKVLVPAFASRLVGGVSGFRRIAFGIVGLSRLAFSS